MKTRFEKIADQLLLEFNSKKNVRSILLEAEEEQKNKKEQKKKDKKPKVEIFDEEETQKDDNKISQKENDFLKKFIKYSELIYLNESTDKIIQDFKRVLGPKNETAVQIINQNKADREQQIASLSKELNSLRQKIQDEAEEANSKVSLLQLLGDEGTTNSEDNLENF